MTVVAALPRTATRLLADRELARTWRAKWRGAEYAGDAGVVHQRKQNDCAAACMKMVLAAHGIERDLAWLETDLASRERGTSLHNMRLAAERQGLQARSWRLAPADLAQAPLPAIAFINGDHFVVVRRLIDSKSIEVDDPALGRLHWPLKAFCKRWSGEILIFDAAWTPRGSLGQFVSMKESGRAGKRRDE